jgi:hypothetical protein
MVIDYPNYKRAKKRKNGYIRKKKRLATTLTLTILSQKFPLPQNPTPVNLSVLA